MTDKYKTTNGLMRHLRDNGVAINGSKEKRQLINTGYFHGYKGYRFFKDASIKLPFKTFSEIQATILYDTKLKSLLYGKIMFIETALKNIALSAIIEEIQSANIYDMYDKVISSFKNAPSNLPEDKKRTFQTNKLSLQRSIQDTITYAYKHKNPKITHFYNNKKHTDVPLWAIFEILTMGDFGYLLSCLTINMREKVSRSFGLNLASDTNRELLYKYVYILKDLRNAVAHNDVVYDTRFRKTEISKPMETCLKTEIGLSYVNFKTIGDFILLICYFLKLLKATRTEINTFIREFEKITSEYKESVNSEVARRTIHRDLPYRLKKLKEYI